MWSRENKRQFRIFQHDALTVLVHRVGSSQIPILVNALHGWDHFHEFIQLARKQAPTLADVPGQFQGLVLSQNKYPPDTRID